VRHTGHVALAVSSLALISGTALAAPMRLDVDPTRSSISFTLDATAHVVEGRFAPPSGRIEFDDVTGEATGRVVVDLTTGQTGIARRDRRMLDEVLETGSYPSAVFRPVRLAGRLVVPGSSRLTLSGVLEFHGADRGLEVPVTVDVVGDRLTGNASISVPYVAWGLKDPSFFVLRVAKEVAVHLTIEGTISERSP